LLRRKHRRREGETEGYDESEEEPPHVRSV
jgi:hypothetical protein